jgi:hypothetical protein
VVRWCGCGCGCGDAETATPHYSAPNTNSHIATHSFPKQPRFLPVHSMCQRTQDLGWRFFKLRYADTRWMLFQLRAIGQVVLPQDERDPGACALRGDLNLLEMGFLRGLRGLRGKWKVVGYGRLLAFLCHACADYFERRPIFPGSISYFSNPSIHFSVSSLAL